MVEWGTQLAKVVELAAHTELGGRETQASFKLSHFAWGGLLGDASVVISYHGSVEAGFSWSIHYSQFPIVNTSLASGSFVCTTDS